MDLVTFAYLSVVLLVLLIAPERPPGWWGHVFFHLGVLCVVASMRYLPSRFMLVRIVKNFYPIFALPFFYDQLAFVNQVISQGYYDAVIIPVESWLFGTQPAIYLRGWLPSRVLSEYLHLSYALYLIIVPVSGFVFYIGKRYDAFRFYVTNTLLTFFLCYIAFILFPVAGPYYAFPRPDPEMIGFIFPEFVHWFTDRGASQGAAFPSSHVAVAVNSAFVVFRLNRKLFWGILPIVIGITIGVVYGGFHYAVDAIVGILVGIGVAVMSPFLYQRLKALIGEDGALSVGAQG
jgi:membrane-associated phospholipid phosphatase